MTRGESRAATVTISTAIFATTVVGMVLAHGYPDAPVEARALRPSREQSWGAARGCEVAVLHAGESLGLAQLGARDLQVAAPKLSLARGISERVRLS